MKSGTILLIVAFAILLVIVGPILTLWALNTLFPALALEYSVANWFAVVILGAALRANVSVKGK